MMSHDLNISSPFRQNVVLSLDDVGLTGELTIPPNAASVVLFVDGSHSSEPSPSVSRIVASELNRFGHATLTFDLTTSEEQDAEELQHRKSFGFQTEFLSHRVTEAYQWLRVNGDTEKLAVGFFGTDEGAEAALLAASHLGRKVSAIVIAGGWINLPAPFLDQVKAPTLFITETDHLEEMLQTRAVAEKLSCEHHVEDIGKMSSDAGEDSNYQRVAERTRKWFSWFLTRK